MRGSGKLENSDAEYSSVSTSAMHTPLLVSTASPMPVYLPGHESPHHGEAHVPRGLSEISSVTWNFTNSILGAGIVGLPYTFYQSGLLGGLLMMATVACLTDYTLLLLVEAGKRARVGNYEDLCRYCFGTKGYYIVSLAMFLFDFGALLTYLIILGDSAAPVLNEIFGLEGPIYRRLSIVVVGSLIILPICSFRDISRIEKFSAFGVGTVFFILFVIIYKFCCHGVNNISGSTINWGFGHSLLTSVGTISFSFVCHDSAFLMYNTLRNPTRQRWGTLAHITLGMSLMVCIGFSVAGYLTFGSNIVSNILNNYAQSNPLIIATRCIYIVTMALCYPVSFFVVRHVVYAAFQQFQQQPQKPGANGPNYISVVDSTNLAFYGITIPLFATTVGIVWYIDNLGFVMALTGSLAAVFLAFVLPCACYLKLSHHQLLFWRNEGEVWEAFKDTTPPILVMIFGVSAGLLSTYSTLAEEFFPQYLLE